MERELDFGLEPKAFLQYANYLPCPPGRRPRFMATVALLANPTCRHI